MPQLLVRNLEAQTKARLQRRAKRHGNSMEEEAREILRSALSDEGASQAGLGTTIANLFKGMGLEKDIPELRGHLVVPIDFEP